MEESCFFLVAGPATKKYIFYSFPSQIKIRVWNLFYPRRWTCGSSCSRPARSPARTKTRTPGPLSSNQYPQSNLCICTLYILSMSQSCPEEGGGGRPPELLRKHFILYKEKMDKIKICIRPLSRYPDHSGLTPLLLCVCFPLKGARKKNGIP